MVCICIQKVGISLAVYDCERTLHDCFKYCTKRDNEFSIKLSTPMSLMTTKLCKSI